MTLREALATILTPPVLARLVAERLETEYVVALALCGIRHCGGPADAADQALLDWCRHYASVWIVENGERHIETPAPPLEGSAAAPM